MKKLFSNYYLARIFIGFGLAVWIFLLCVIISNHALSCVDKNGCLKSTCKYAWLKRNYKNIVYSNRDKCFYEDISKTFEDDGLDDNM
jgi:hypothetical protein